MNHLPRILAARVSKTLPDTLEVLCLEWGMVNRFRLYTMTEGDLSESVWDLDPVEFSNAEEIDAITYLVESLWLTEIGIEELRTACGLYTKGIAETPAAARHKSSIALLGSLGVLLTEALNRVQTIDPAAPNSPDALRRIEKRLQNLSMLPELSSAVLCVISDCRSIYLEAIAAANQQPR